MSCENKGRSYKRLSLIDGAVEGVHFKPIREVLVSTDRLPKVEFKPTGAKIERSFVPFLIDVNMTGL